MHAGIHGTLREAYVRTASTVFCMFTAARIQKPT
jgi:hypothetical protein